ncbi:hypothetical protein BJ878DRAFT_482196 [Calycina marina]|uniref:Uncharacterized protein n=1 Tax=Calycina marina TaxID=1763456 RepID=A0A9P7YZV6_9HELO|nr:hypothetical protein BJ878DRAFT_482196 [Calycina marina]
MSWLQGESILKEEWDNLAKGAVSKQLTSCVPSWRNDVPLMELIGNRCSLPKLSGMAIGGSLAHYIGICSYYRARIDKVVQTLCENDNFAPNRDLSPRNVLGTGSPPKITDIVGFDLAAFYPPLEEFTNDTVDNEGDEDPVIHLAYTSALGFNDMKMKTAGLWDDTIRLARLAANLALWQLAEGGVKGDDLSKALDVAAGVVKQMIAELSQ